MTTDDLYVAVSWFLIGVIFTLTVLYGIGFICVH